MIRNFAAFIAMTVTVMVVLGAYIIHDVAITIL